MLLEHNEFYAPGNSGVFIKNNSAAFSAHNLALKIGNNKFFKAKNDGMQIENLAISKLLIHNNEFFMNLNNGCSLLQVHQKSNKHIFLIAESKFK